jgi:hypothetical protein
MNNSFPENASDHQLNYFIEVTAWALGMAVAEREKRNRAKK